MQAVVGAIQLINQPAVKEGIKWAVSAPTFLFGAYALTDQAYSMMRPKMRKASAITTLARYSLILSMLTSKPGTRICQRAVDFLLPHPIVHLFGPNIHFAGNPWHPRHLCNLASFSLALVPAANATYRSIRPSTQPPTDDETIDRTLQLFSLYTLFFHRTTLHLCNVLAKSAL